MSTDNRHVDVLLRAGEKYVLRNGRHVTVQVNPHWQCAALFPFAVIQGPDFIVYYKDNGHTGATLGEAHEQDIMRPVYEEGEVYMSRSGERCEILRDDNDVNYPLENDDHSWSRTGRCVGMTPHEADLMDYAPALPVFHAVGDIPIPPPELADPWVGKRVQFDYEGRSGYGKVIAKNENAGSQHYAIEMESGNDGHDCSGLVRSGHGWNVPVYAMSEVLQGKRVDLVIVDEVFAVPELAPVEASPSLVGLRVEVNLDCATTARGVVKFEDTDGYVAVEIDADVQWQGLHSCNGHCNDERGWWALRDSLRAVSEAETPVEAERSEALTEVDVAEVWAAYRINPSIDIDSWIEARRKLKAAAK